MSAYGQGMSELRHSTVETNGIRMHVVETGPADGPVVLMCHGFPESWYSWRHQLPALAEAGFRAVAPDMRGYGGTDAPSSPLAYSQLHQPLPFRSTGTSDATLNEKSPVLREQEIFSFVKKLVRR